MKNLWFKAKNYGWGWYPSSWQGWLVLLLYLGVVIFAASDIDSRSHSVSDALIGFSPILVVATLILVLICWKTGEKPEWRWGGKKK